jgi:hypothetical protein
VGPQRQQPDRLRRELFDETVLAKWKQSRTALPLAETTHTSAVNGVLLGVGDGQFNAGRPLQRAAIMARPEPGWHQ